MLSNRFRTHRRRGHAARGALVRVGMALTVAVVLGFGSPPRAAGQQGAPAQPQSIGTPAQQEQAKPSQAMDENTPDNSPPPPDDLVVLVKKAGLKGPYRLGVFGRKPDPSDPQVWRINLWEQTLDRVFLSTDVLNCSPKQPMRITGGSAQGSGRLILRDLNPGGPITPINRLDHQIWWAACFPEQAGKDPATLAAEARRLGFSGTVVEREQVVPIPRRP